MGVDVTEQKLRALGGRPVYAYDRPGMIQLWVAEVGGELIRLDVGPSDSLRLLEALKR